MNEPAKHFYDFGPFRLDAAERLLWRGSELVPLTPRLLDILIVLVEHRGHLLEKDAVIRAVWGDTAVEEGNLARNVSALRKALGDSPNTPRYIETMPWRGYRFVADVRESRADALVAEPSRTQAVAPQQRWGPAPRSPAWMLGASAVVLVLAAVLVAGLRLRGGTPKPRGAENFLSIDTIAPRKLTTTGDVFAGSISPDGQFIVYSRRDPDERAALWLRRTGGGPAVLLVSPAPVTYWGANFSPDANDVYFVTASEGRGTLYRVPVLGGTPRKLAENVDSPVTFSPDGRRMAFDRFRPGACDLVLANATDGGAEQVLASAPSTSSFLSPQWSPDGASILYYDIERTASGNVWRLSTIPVRGGPKVPVLPPSRQRIWFATWQPDGRGVLLNLTDEITHRPQLFALTLADGAMRRITNDLSQHFGVLTTADGSAILTGHQERPTNIWVVPHLDPRRARQITSGLSYHDALSWTPDGRLVFDQTDEGRHHVWIMDADGGHRQQLSPDPFDEWLPAVSPDGRHIAFLSNRSGTYEVWRMDIDGGDPKQLTSGNRRVWRPRFAPDGRHVDFQMAHGPRSVVARVSIDGGTPVTLTDASVDLWAVSPDGARLAYSFVDERPARLRLAVASLGRGGERTLFDVAPQKFLSWMPDRRGLVYERVDPEEARSAIWVQPLSGGPPRRLMRVDGDTIFWADWSRDGKHLALVRGRVLSDLVLLTVRRR